MTRFRNLPWAIALVLLGLAACNTRPRKLVIGSKDFTEQIILGHMVAELAEARLGLRTDRRFNLGGTMVCYASLLKGDLDLYPEYTGTLLTAVLRKPLPPDRGLIYADLRRELGATAGLVLMPPLGFNNTYALMTSGGKGPLGRVRSITGLSPLASGLRTAFTSEFLERPDGYQGLTRAYGFAFSGPRQMAPGLMYSALAEGKVDLISGFATDGRIKAYGLTVLQDDKSFFPPYEACLLVRRKSLKAFPGLEAALLKLGGALDDRTMRTLNASVDMERREPRAVAREFLKSRGLLGE